MDVLLKSSIICNNQKNRLRKSLYQAFYLVETIFTIRGAILKITGSTLNIYTIKLIDLNIYCDCPDSFRNIFCKHICFVIYIIGKINNEELFTTKFLTPKERNTILSRLENNCSLDPDIVSEYFINKYKNRIEKSKEETLIELNIRNLNDDCPICYIILDNKDNIYSCQTCNNGVHKECMNMWLKHKKTCIFCRSIVLEDIKKEDSKYINISK
jgi:hypothetical protein